MIGILLTLSLAQTPIPQSDHATELTEHINSFLANFPARRARAQAMIPAILRYCELYDVDPLYIAVLAKEESSWGRPRLGKRGEVGPLQVMPRWFKKRFGLEDLDGQIHAGVWFFNQGLQKCGKGAAAYHWYKFGNCAKQHPYPGARRRDRLYRKAVKKYRKPRVFNHCEYAPNPFRE